MKKIITQFIYLVAVLIAGKLDAQDPAAAKEVKLKDIFLRDVCILPDKASGTYYMIGPGKNVSVVEYTSKDLDNWIGPKEIFKAPDGLWPDAPIVAVWAPEMHHYKDKYYLFLTFSSNKLLTEQWLNWRPRVVRGSQILVGDSPAGPFKAFQNHATTPTDMMTLDGTFWEEDGKPYMIFSHEWVQISNGAMEYLPLKDDLSEATGLPQLLFRASEAKWVPPTKAEGSYITDGPYLYRSKSGKLMMIWSSFSPGGYTVGVAISASGKLAGPWTQDDKPLFDKDGGHGMLFKTFDGKLMMVLHTPNNKSAQPHLYYIEDTGKSLKLTGEKARD